jgi:anti-sigma B factor antagonist
MASAVRDFPHDVDLSAGSDESGPGIWCLLGEPGVLSVCGDVDLSTAEELRRYLQVLARGASGTCVVDLAGVTFMGCAGLAPLVEARRHLGLRLRLRAPSPAVEKLLRATGLTGYFGLRAPPGAARR